MRKNIKKSIIATLTVATLLGSSLSVCAAPKTMADGTVFDAEFYAETYPDVKQALGTDESALYNHYVTYGKAEGRKPYADAVTAKTDTAGIPEDYYNHPCINDANGNVIFVLPPTNEFVENANKTHNYYKNIPSDYAIQCEITSASIAYEILSNPDYKTDLQKISRAAQIVKNYCDNTTYGADSAKWYRSPLGLYSNTYYTCAGSTRTLGRILDYMGYEWIHTNENQNKHQWCIVTIDGQTGWADGMAGYAGYGELKNGMTLSDGKVITFAE